ncbi:MAG: PQQ-binding-like beta-propeller repeat protein [Verrucomicrobiota bacterium]
MKNFLRYFFLGVVILFGPAVFFWIRMQEMTYLNWFNFVALFPWAILFGIWYLIFGKSSPGRRFLYVGGVFVGVILIGILLSQLLRYEGSASGSSFPRFAWVWEPETPESSATAELVRTEISAEESRLVAAMGDSLDFLGPDRNGVYPMPSFETDWTTNPPELLWRTPIGKAWSGFAVQGRHAITQAQAGDAEQVLCLDLFTGEEVWKHDNPNTRLLLVKEENSGAAMGGDGPRSTPVIHESRVYALGATGILNCLDVATGKEIWTRNLMDEFKGGVQKWGSANSVLLVQEEGLVVIPGSDEPGASLIALDRETGADRWTWEGRGASYSSPRIFSIEDVRMLVSVNRHDVTGHDPASGEVLWKYNWEGAFPKVGQPISAGDNRILVTASYGVGSPLLELTKTPDGTWTVEELCKSTRMKTKFSSAFVIGDHAYGIDEGRLAAIHLADGTKAWKNQKVGFGQHLLFGDQLLVQTERGPVIVGPIGPDGFVETSRLDALEGMTWNVPTVAGRFLLVRNDKEGACYLLPGTNAR